MTTLLTIPEAAVELRVHRDTVYKLISDGLLRAVDARHPSARKSKTRVRREDLAAYVASLPSVGAA
jgi:excisionase family DNA binding protein